MDDLNIKTRRVLEAVYNNGGEATSPEIKEQTGIEKSATIRYHAVDVLEDAGLVQCSMESTSEHPSGVRVVEITEKGRDRIAHLFEEDEDIPIKQRMEDIESRFHETEEHVTELIGEIREVEQTAEMGYQQSEKAVKVAAESKKNTQEIEEDLDTKIQEIHDEMRSDLGTIHQKIDELNMQVEYLQGLDARIGEIEAKLSLLDIGEPEPEDLEDVPAELVENLSSETIVDKVAQYLKQLDPREENITIDTNEELRSHLREKFPGISESELDTVSERVTLNP
jgi:DNA-binding PadR family transcriptional regulator